MYASDTLSLVLSQSRHPRVLERVNEGGYGRRRASREGGSTYGVVEARQWPEPRLVPVLALLPVPASVLRADRAASSQLGQSGWSALRMRLLHQ